MSKFTRSPIIVDKESEIESFVHGANLPRILNNHPWENLDDKEKTKGVNLRLTKADLAKLQYIAENTPFSIQRFVYQFVRQAIDEKIAQLIKQP